MTQNQYKNGPEYIQGSIPAPVSGHLYIISKFMLYFTMLAVFSDTDRYTSPRRCHFTRPHKFPGPHLNRKNVSHWIFANLLTHASGCQHPSIAINTDNTSSQHLMHACTHHNNSTSFQSSSFQSHSHIHSVRCSRNLCWDTIAQAVELDTQLGECGHQLLRAGIHFER